MLPPERAGCVWLCLFFPPMCPLLSPAAPHRHLSQLRFAARHPGCPPLSPPHLAQGPPGCRLLHGLAANLREGPPDLTVRDYIQPCLGDWGNLCPRSTTSGPQEATRDTVRPWANTCAEEGSPLHVRMWQWEAHSSPALLSLVAGPGT